MHVKRKISSNKNTIYQDLKEHDSHSGAVSMFEVICREIKIMLVDTWVGRHLGFGADIRSLPDLFPGYGCTV